MIVFEKMMLIPETTSIAKIQITDRSPIFRKNKNIAANDMPPELLSSSGSSFDKSFCLFVFLVKIKISLLIRDIHKNKFNKKNTPANKTSFPKALLKTKTIVENRK